MLGRLGAMIGTLMLGACGTAGASTSDSGDPAHCIAAFSYGRTIAVRARPVEISLAVQSTARSLYEGRKLKARGRFEDGRREAEALLAEHAGDEEAMNGLLLDCLKRQDADPAYRALNESGALMAVARRVDPTCREDATCRFGVR